MTLNTNNNGLHTGRSKLTKWVTVGLCAILVISVLLWYLRRPVSIAGNSRPSNHANVEPHPTARQTPDPPPRRAAARQAKTPEDGGAAESSLGLHPGDRLIYDFSASQRVELAGPNVDFAQSGAAFQSVGVDLTQEGQLILDVYSALPSKRWLVGFRFASFAFERKVDFTSADPMKAEIEKQMMQSNLLVELLETGKFGKIVPSSLVVAETKILWKDILSRWQVVLPDDPETNTWVQTENDATGAYVAKYTRPSLVYPQRITKNKVRYTAVAVQEQGGSLNPKSFVQSETAIELNPYPLSIRGEEAFSINGPGGAVVKTYTVYSYQLRSAEYTHSVEASAPQMLEAIQAATNALSWTAENTDSSDADVDKTPEEIAAIIRELEALLRSGQAHGGQHVELAGELIDTIKAGIPETVSMIMDTLAEDSPSEEYAATLIGILGAAGTPAAQQALLEIIVSADWLPRLRAMALQSLVQVTDPVAEADKILMILCDDDQEYASSAYLILAAIGERIRESDPVRRETISRFVLERAFAANPADNAQMTLVLAAIANLGPADVPSIVADVLAGDDAGLREQAVMSLQRIYTDEAITMIGAASSNSNEAVRSAAVRMLGDPKRNGGFDMLRTMASNDPSEAVRSAAIMGLTQWNREGDETVANILKQLSENDASEDVRNTARSQMEFLQGYQSLPGNAYR